MKLIDLKPRWVSPHRFPDNWKTGVSFVCPKCGTHRVAVMFDVPVSPDPMSDVERDSWNAVVTHQLNGMVWKRTGATFDTLTLAPSVDWSGSGCWHGFVENGDVR
jgi:hypothetical protein